MAEKEDWPTVRLIRHKADGEMGFEPDVWEPEPEFQELETYIPESALLSDAVVEIALSKGSLADPLLRPVNRAVIVAALEAALTAAKEP